jgi:hypothetical protein
MCFLVSRFSLLQNDPKESCRAASKCKPILDCPSGRRGVRSTSCDGLSTCCKVQVPCKQRLISSHPFYTLFHYRCKCRDIYTNYLHDQGSIPGIHKEGFSLLALSDRHWGQLHEPLKQFVGMFISFFLIPQSLNLTAYRHLLVLSKFRMNFALLSPPHKSSRYGDYGSESSLMFLSAAFLMRDFIPASDLARLLSSSVYRQQSSHTAATVQSWTFFMNSLKRIQEFDW